MGYGMHEFHKYRLFPCLPSHWFRNVINHGSWEILDHSLLIMNNNGKEELPTKDQHLPGA
jgi:hypothetical protein